MKHTPDNLSHLWETPVSTELIYDGEVLHLYKDVSTLPNGEPATREYIRHIGAICVVPLTKEGEVICVKQYRYPFADVLLEIPAGKRDTFDEDPNETVVRELREETGAVSGKLTYLGVCYPSPAILDEKIYMFLAEDLTFGETDRDEDEFIDLVRIPFAELKSMVLNGEIPDAKTQLAVLRAAAVLEKRKAE